MRLWGWLPHDRNWLAAATQFPGTLFFNVSTFAALTHNATAAESDRYVWRPDLFGSMLFLVSSAFGRPRRLAAGSSASSRGPVPWRIAWLNMLGSVLFMASALASYVLPSTDELLERARRRRRHPARRRVLPRRRRPDVPRLAPCRRPPAVGREHARLTDSTPDREPPSPSPKEKTHDQPIRRSTPTRPCSATASSPRRCRAASSRTTG